MVDIDRMSIVKHAREKTRDEVKWGDLQNKFLHKILKRKRNLSDEGRRAFLFVDWIMAYI